MSQTELQGHQVVLEQALAVLRKAARSDLNAILPAIDSSLDSPIRLYASNPSDSKLNFNTQTVQVGDGTSKSISPISGAVPTIVASTIDFQAQTTSGATFIIAFPASTVGQFRRAGFSLTTAGSISVSFSAEAASVGALADPGTLMATDALPLGYIDLQCTDVLGKFKTAGSSTNIIENSVSGTSRIFNFTGARTASSTALPATYSVTAGENLSDRTPIYISLGAGDGGRTAGRAYKLDPTNSQRAAFAGFTTTAVSTGSPVSIQFSDELNGFVALTLGQLQYGSVTTPGSLQTTVPSAYGQTIVEVGEAISTTSILVNAALASANIVAIASTVLVTTGDTNNDNTLTNLASTANLVQGMAVSGAAIPAGTVIARISGSTVFMNNQALATAVGITVTFSHVFAAGSSTQAQLDEVDAALALRTSVEYDNGFVGSSINQITINLDNGFAQKIVVANSSPTFIFTGGRPSEVYKIRFIFWFLAPFNGPVTLDPQIREGSFGSPTLATGPNEEVVMYVYPIKDFYLVSAQVYSAIAPAKADSIFTGQAGSFLGMSKNNNYYLFGSNLFGQLGISHSGSGGPINMPQPLSSVIGVRSFSQIVIGGNHTAAIETSTGNAYCWGLAGSGQLGDNQTLFTRDSPVSTFGARSFSQITAGQSQTIAIEGVTGNAYAWGVNTNGTLGDGTTNNSSSPVSVQGARSFSKVAGGSATGAIEGSTGNAYAWGLNGSGQVGDNSITNRSSPVSVVGARSFSQITAGQSFFTAIEGSTGNAYAWGLAAQGQLGDNQVAANRSSPVSVVGARSFTQVACGQTHNIAIEGSTGNAYAWGLNTQGQLGDGTTATRSSPTSVIGARSFSQVAAGAGWSAGIDGATGLVYVWGLNTTGMGLRARADTQTLPSPIDPAVHGGILFNPIGPVILISTNNPHVSAIDKATGTAYCWGNGTSGALGGNTANSINNQSSPLSVVGSRSFSKIASGDGFTVAIEGSTGNAYCWGLASGGQLGDNQVAANRSSPVSVFGARSFSQIVAGIFSSAIEGSTGNAYAWGTSSSGGLGDNTTTARSSPVSVVGARSFSKITRVANSNTAAIEGSTGNAYAWGDNSVGQVGDNTNTNRSSPTSVVGARSFSQIAGGGAFSASTTNGFVAAIEGSTGNAYCWGGSVNGSLGDNTNNNRSSPVSVVGARSFSKITAGESFVAAIEGSTGKVFCWGTNTNGQLGNGTTTNSSSPISVLGIVSFSAVTAVQKAVLALEAVTGTVYAWGLNSVGIFGDGFNGSSVTSPTSIGRILTY